LAGFTGGATANVARAEANQLYPMSSASGGRLEKEKSAGNKIDKSVGSALSVRNYNA